MKKQKLAVVFAALLTMVGFSSCLKDDGISQSVGYFEVNSELGSVTFSDVLGLKLVPNQVITTSSNSKLAYIYYQYNDADYTADTKNLPITLLENPVFLTDLGSISSMLPDENETVSLYSLGDGGVWGYNKYLILAPAIYLKKGTTIENLSTELANHRLNLYYLPDEDDENSNTLKLYLRYEIAGVGDSAAEEADDKESWASDYTIQYSRLSYVNLQPIISMYKSTHDGKEPEKVIVEYEYNNSNNSTSSVPTIAKKQTETVTYTLYKDTSSSN